MNRQAWIEEAAETIYHASNRLTAYYLACAVREVLDIAESEPQIVEGLEAAIGTFGMESLASLGYLAPSER